MKNSILILILFLMNNFAQAHTCESQKVSCPIDGTTVVFCVTTSMTSFNSFYDFQKKGATGSHYEELINSCPNCHFSGYISDFKTQYSQEEKKTIKEFLSGYNNVLINDAIECDIAGDIKEFLNEKNDVISNCYLLGSYLVRFDSTRTFYRRELQKKTIKYLKRAIEYNEYEEPSIKANVNYLIGELYRRTSNFKNAIIHYDIAINDENKNDWIAEMAIEQKGLAIKKDDDNSI